MIFLFLKVAVLTLVLFLFLIFSGDILSGVPWLPTRRKDYNRIAKLASLKPGLFFYDLGSGSGEMLFYLSKQYNLSCVGIERSPILYLYSKIKSLFYNRVEIHYGDFLKHDLLKADVIYVFLHPKIYNKLKRKIEINTKKGAKIILAYWPFRNSSPAKISEEIGEAIYYLYIK